MRFDTRQALATGTIPWCCAGGALTLPAIDQRE